MVTYDRDFLVPYLKNLCTLYYAQQKLNTEYYNTQQQIAQYTGDLPRQYFYEEKNIHWTDLPAGTYGLACFIVCVIFLPILLWDSDAFARNIFLFFCISFLVASIISILYSIKQAASVNLNINYINTCEKQRIKEKNAHIEAENLERKNKRQQYTSMANAISEEYREVQRIIDRAYSANIIPGNYRDMYAVVYLYDYFSKSRSNDMDIALNTYVLEQIKAKLDIIIQNQSEMLLNQELMLANQERALDERRAHNKRLEQKIDHMNCELEEANQYRQVIHSDLETANFFARDSYIRRLCS